MTVYRVLIHRRAKKPRSGEPFFAKEGVAPEMTAEWMGTHPFFSAREAPVKGSTPFTATGIGKAEGKEACGPSLSLQAVTKGEFKLVSYHVQGEKKKSVEPQEGGEKKQQQYTGTMHMRFAVKTSIHLPSIPSGLRPCQVKRVKAAIRHEVMPHEKQHQRIMQGFAGKSSFPVSFVGTESAYNDHLKAVAMSAFQKRRAQVMEKSDALDPFEVKVDLCCEDKPKKAKA